jgi:hypothetical protein
VSYRINKNPESPKFKADKSRLFKTHIVAVALPGNYVLLKPIIKMRETIITHFQNIGRA